MTKIEKQLQRIGVVGMGLMGSPMACSLLCAGYPVGVFEYGLLVLLALAIAVSIQVVGIILVVAMLVTPAATAQLLTGRFDHLLVRRRGVNRCANVAASRLCF